MLRGGVADHRGVTVTTAALDPLGGADEHDRSPVTRCTHTGCGGDYRVPNTDQVDIDDVSEHHVGVVWLVAAERGYTGVCHDDVDRSQLTRCLGDDPVQCL